MAAASSDLARRWDDRVRHQTRLRVNDRIGASVADRGTSLVIASQHGA